MDNDSKKIIELKWFKGVRMANEKNKFLENSVAVAILVFSVGISLGFLIKAITPLILGLK